MNHGDVSQAFGYRIETPDRTIVISGDAAPSHSVIDSCNGCDVLIHEAYSMMTYNAVSSAYQEYRRKHHTSSREVAEILPNAQHVVSYHVVSGGTCWVTLADGPPVHLDTGDIVLIPRGDSYVMSSASGMCSEISAEAVLLWFRRMATGSAPASAIEGGRGSERVDLVCGFLGCNVRPFNPVVEALPSAGPSSAASRRADARSARSADRVRPLPRLRKVGVSPAAWRRERSRATGL